ncbi:MAG: hypothetical protein JWN21_656 [Sphingomonas bacterium]|uniref:hypothetical protein n=1 Tax=Sphingomonas bacterium TaxID=1895847 RepID=UPI0026185959|nr:hypothetical protein [Sphingomonas bacterium]MDB5695113.1 hypothetical protein [Sphingomonas bacterium]
MILLALLLQAAPPITAAPVTRMGAAPPERFSILAQPCAPIERDGKEVVVCGKDLSTSQRLPLPDEVVPDRPVPSNPYKTGTGALVAERSPCATLQGGCQVGFGPPIGQMLGAAITGVGNALKDRREARAKKHDGDKRVAIDLAAAAPAGRLER